MWLGFDMAKAAADDVYNKSGVSPADIDVVERCHTHGEFLRLPIGARRLARPKMRP